MKKYITNVRVMMDDEVKAAPVVVIAKSQAHALAILDEEFARQQRPIPDNVKFMEMDFVGPSYKGERK
jgi:hypothetical protein